MRPYRAVALAAAVAAAVLSAGSAAAAPAEDRSRIVAPARPGDPPATDRDHDRLADDLAARLGRATGSDRVDVIVRGVGVGGARAAVGSFAVRRLLPLVDGFSARVTAGQARALTRVPGVVRVDAVRTVRVTDTATDRDFGVALARQTFSTTGAGVGVCVVDTGVDPAHEQIAPRTVVFRDLIGTGTQPYDDHGHGTHVASIAAGDGDSATGTTSATAAATSASRRAPASTRPRFSTREDPDPYDVVLSGIQWCAAQPGVDVVSMSLGDSVPSDGSDPMSVAVDQATADGTAVVVAAGNAGDAPSTIPSPGAARTAITVGAVSDWSAPAGADYRDAGIALAPFSSRGPVLAPGGSYAKPDVSAPGVTVSAADAGTGAGYVTFSGTSMAAPYVAGVVALGLQAAPASSPAQVAAALEGAAVDRGLAGRDSEWGSGLVDAEAFVQRLTGATNQAATTFQAGPPARCRRAGRRRSRCRSRTAASRSP